MMRRYLFLQGVCSPFFRCLGESLRSKGHYVAKVNFNGGDALSWLGGNAVAYRGRVDGLADFYAQQVERRKISDVVLFGDQRPVHRIMTQQAKALGIRVHVYEEGYFRPHWVTLEQDGVNAHSHLPRDPDWYMRACEHVPHVKSGSPLPSPFRVRAWHDVMYHMGSIANPLMFPRYRTHSPVIAPIEYLHYIKRGVRLPLQVGRDAGRLEGFLSSGQPYYFLPLQLGSDAQILAHSPFNCMNDVLRYVLESFAHNAPASTSLIIKNHPLDPGLVRYTKQISKLCSDLDISGRVLYVETGDTPLLVKHAVGVVTVNSTVGSSALLHRRPTKTLGSAIYDMPGLTHQGDLDGFWCNPEEPDMRLFRAFRDVVIHATQIDGGFYTGVGISRACKNSMQALVGEQSALQRLLDLVKVEPKVWEGPSSSGANRVRTAGLQKSAQEDSSVSLSAPLSDVGTTMSGGFR